MTELTLCDAVARLSERIAKLDKDDIREVYNELFPTEPVAESAVSANRSTVVDRINHHIAEGLEPEEILDLWNVVFPREKHVSYDEQAKTFHFAGESLQYAD